MKYLLETLAAKAPPEIQHSLVLSTAHLPLQVAKDLDNSTRDTRSGWCSHPWGEPVDYGYRVWVPDDIWECPKYPEAVRAAGVLALALGCTYLVYDMDAETIPALVELGFYYEW